MRFLSEDEAKRLANQFAGRHSISSFKKREALSVLIAEVFFLGYEAGINDLGDKLKVKETANV